MIGQGSSEGRQDPPQNSGDSILPKNQWEPPTEVHLTAAKRQEHNSFYTQPTPRPQRKILLYGENKSRFLFPLMRDRDIGIEVAYQNVVIQSHNDDDRETTSTQLQRGMVQTLEDLYEVLSRTNSKSSATSSYYTQQRQ